MGRKVQSGACDVWEDAAFSLLCPRPPFPHTRTCFCMNAPIRPWLILWVIPSNRSKNPPFQLIFFRNLKYHHFKLFRALECNCVTFCTRDVVWSSLLSSLSRHKSVGWSPSAPSVAPSSQWTSQYALFDAASALASAKTSHQFFHSRETVRNVGRTEEWNFRNDVSGPRQSKGCQRWSWMDEQSDWGFRQPSLNGCEDLLSSRRGRRSEGRRWETPVLAQSVFPFIFPPVVFFILHIQRGILARWDAGLICSSCLQPGNLTLYSSIMAMVNKLILMCLWRTNCMCFSTGRWSAWIPYTISGVENIFHWCRPHDGKLAHPGFLFLLLFIEMAVSKLKKNMYISLTKNKV